MVPAPRVPGSKQKKIRGTRHSRSRYLGLLPFLVLLGLLAGKIFLAGPLEGPTLRVFDFYARLQPRDWRESPVVMADIDDETLNKLGQWPWPRTQVAGLAQKLFKAGASAIVFDIIFAEPDRTSPSRVLPLWPETPEIKMLRSKAAGLPDHDALFSKALEGIPAVTGFVLTGEKNRFQPVLKAGFAFAGGNPLSFLPAFRGAVVNLPEIEKAAHGNGSFSFIAERDGLIRRVPLLFRYQDALYPSLVAEALRVKERTSSYIIRSSGASGETNFGERTGIVSVKIGNFVVPTDGEGRIWLYDTSDSGKRVFPAWKIFTEDFDLKSVFGKIVFIGTSAAGLKDLRATALHPVMAGTAVHVALTEQILLGEFLHRPDWAPGAETLFLFILGLLLVLLMPRFGALGCAFFGAAAIAAAFFISWRAFIQLHLLLDPVIPSTASLMLYLISSLIHYLKTERERREVKTAFSRYLSPELVNQLAKHPEKLKLGGEEKEMTVLFSDIRDFTTLSEKFKAEELTRFINHYLTPMTGIILNEKGTIDKYIGDCIMAFWNAPLEDPLHAAHAGQAALKMQDHLKQWNVQMGSSLRMGIGINTGSCCVGNLGSDQRFDYSVLGDEVNLASRLEGLCTLFGIDIVIGPNTYEKIKEEFGCLELDLAQVKGKTKPVKVYGLLGDSSLKSDSFFLEISNLHEEMLEKYRQRHWEEAKNLISKIQGYKIPEINLEVFYQIYIQRIDTLLAHPPGPDWNGVTVLTVKS